MSLLARRVSKQEVIESIWQQTQDFRHHAHLPRNDAITAAGSDGFCRFPRKCLGGHQERHGVIVDLRHRRIDIAGRNGDDPDAILLQLHAQGFTITDDGSLGCAVGAGAG